MDTINVTIPETCKKQYNHDQDIFVEEKSNIKDSIHKDHYPLSPTRNISEFSFSDVFRMKTESDITKKSCEQISINIYDENSSSTVINSSQGKYSFSNPFVVTTTTEYKYDNGDEPIINNDNDMDLTRKGGKVIRNLQTNSSTSKYYDPVFAYKTTRRTPTYDYKTKYDSETQIINSITESIPRTLFLTSMESESKTNWLKDNNRKANSNLYHDIETESTVHIEMRTSEMYETKEISSFRGHTQNVQKSPFLPPNLSLKTENGYGLGHESGLSITLKEAFNYNTSSYYDDYDWYLELEN